MSIHSSALVTPTGACEHSPQLNHCQRTETKVPFSQAGLTSEFKGHCIAISWVSRLSKLQQPLHCFHQPFLGHYTKS